MSLHFIFVNNVRPMVIKLMCLKFIWFHRNIVTLGTFKTFYVRVLKLVPLQMKGVVGTVLALLALVSFCGDVLPLVFG